MKKIIEVFKSKEDMVVLEKENNKYFIKSVNTINNKWYTKEVKKEDAYKKFDELVRIVVNTNYHIRVVRNY